MVPILGILSVLVEPISKLISEAIPDPDKRMEAQAKIQTILLENEAQVRSKAADIVLAEVQGESAAQRNWRPHLMYTGMFVIVWTGILAPIAQGLFGVELPIVEIFTSVPDQLWQLLQIGMGGYIVGRSGEKIAKTYFEAQNGKQQS